MCKKEYVVLTGSSISSNQEETPTCKNSCTNMIKYDLSYLLAWLVMFTETKIEFEGFELGRFYK